MRILVVGGCRTGKTTFAEDARKVLNIPNVHCTDELIRLGWSQASEVASYWLDLPGPWIVEGVAAVRALRKWLDRNRTGKPADRIFRLTEAVVGLKDGQSVMNKGEETVWRQIEPELQRREVTVEHGVWGRSK